MQEQYQDTLKEVGRYIHFLEEIILTYENEYSKAQKVKLIESNTVDEEENHYQWMHSKTEGSDDKARGEALNKAYARAQYEKKLDNDENS